MTIHDITRLIVLLAGKSTAQEFSWAVLLFKRQKHFLPEPAFGRNRYRQYRLENTGNFLPEKKKGRARQIDRRLRDRREKEG